MSEVKEFYRRKIEFDEYFAIDFGIRDVKNLQIDPAFFLGHG